MEANTTPKACRPPQTLTADQGKSNKIRPPSASSIRQRRTWARRIPWRWTGRGCRPRLGDRRPMNQRGPRRGPSRHPLMDDEAIATGEAAPEKFPVASLLRSPKEQPGDRDALLRLLCHALVLFRDAGLTGIPESPSIRIMHTGRGTHSTYVARLLHPQPR